MKNNLKRGSASQIIIILIAVILVGGLSYYAGNKNSTKSSYQQTNIEQSNTQDDNRIDSNNNVNITNNTTTDTTNWKTYNFNGSDYINSGPISFKYPSDWKLNFDYYTTPSGVSSMTGITITSPSQIEQISFTNGGPQGSLSCDKLLELNNSEPHGRLACNMIGGTPFYLTYNNNQQAVEIFNKIASSIKRSPVKVNYIKTLPQVSNYGTQGKCGINIDYPIANSIVKFPVTITGNIDNSNREELGCTWVISEGQAATAQLYYNYNNHGWTPADVAIPVNFNGFANGDVAIPVNFNGFANGKATFSTVMNFRNDNDIVISVGTPMKIVFKDVNEKDGSIANTFELPINYR